MPQEFPTYRRLEVQTQTQTRPDVPLKVRIHDLGKNMERLLEVRDQIVKREMHKIYNTATTEVVRETK